ncbi:MAG: VOC family protein [Rhizobiaceae bacterium]|nr:VOC family protein [Rhizobiaceae bacterium]
MVDDFEISRAFWVDVLGFSIAYQRAEQHFAYLERPEGAQIMICQRDGQWETSEMETPFGRGVMFQINIDSIDLVVEKLAALNWPIKKGPYEVWRRYGDREGGRHEIVLQDPDGYLVMMAVDLGERPILEK